MRIHIIPPTFTFFFSALLAQWENPIERIPFDEVIVYGVQSPHQVSIQVTQKA